MIKSELRKLIFSTKEEIVKIITAKYLADNEGLFPNWEEEEEIVVDDTDIPTFRISIEVDNTYDESTCIERQAINEYRVTNDGNLFFVCGDCDNEINYTEVSTDELIAIYDLLVKTFPSYKPKRETFDCVTLSRADFEDKGYDTSNLSDGEMERIASRIGDNLVENLYWENIDVWGQDMPRIKGFNDDDEDYDNDEE